MEQAEVVEKLLEAAEMHVPFDGWGTKPLLRPVGMRKSTNHLRVYFCLRGA